MVMDMQSPVRTEVQCMHQGSSGKSQEHYDLQCLFVYRELGAHHRPRGQELDQAGVKRFAIVLHVVLPGDVLCWDQHLLETYGLDDKKQGSSKNGFTC